MMYRYIALSWNRANGKAASMAECVMSQLPKVSPHQWQKTYDAPGLVIFHSGEAKGRMQTYHTANDQGVILGKLFKNGSDGEYFSQIDDLNDSETEKCLRSKTQHLIDNYWGRYVTFLHDRANDTKYVMRDPSGAFPCFYTPYEGVEIYFSDMQDAANFEFLPFTVNYEYLKINFVMPFYQKTHTGLNEVSEVLPAECVEITPDGKNSRFVWNPTEIAETDMVEDPEEAAKLLRKTVKNTITALAGCYDSIIHNLGGLDSSIVLACLADAAKRPDITCINYYTKSPIGEERFYSRQMANKAGVPLVEVELDYRKADLTKIFQSNRLVNPLGFFDCIGLTGDVLNLAKEKNAQAIFYGVGGDNVFFQTPRNFGALDYIHYHGFGKDTLKIWTEASRYGRESLGNTFRSMLRERIAPAPCYQYVHDKMYEDFKIPFINPKFVIPGGHGEFLHPLLMPNERMAKGKYLHILMSALLSVEHYDHWDISYFAERLHTYLTQPIIETCMRIPIWILTYSGIERGLARKAFQCDLPQDIVQRFSKSGPTEYYRNIYEHNTDLLRENLLNGILVQENILLRNKLEEAISKKDVFLTTVPHQILGYFATEAWLQGWIERQTKPTELNVAV